MDTKDSVKNHKHTNKLINEESPYLLQHAHNPVDWYPWGEEAFTKAKKENKVIFLSIGYATCHWCHVMERESFENSAVAEIMNKNFIAVKVDREERPDIDHIYMTVCQMMTKHGGWPLTILMTPEKKPFFAGTYFPKNTTHGRVGLIEILTKVNDLWKENKADLVKQGDQISSYLAQMETSKNDGPIDQNIFRNVFNNFSNNYDEEFGGFGESPKFPSPHNLLFLLRYWDKTKNHKALDIVENTLVKMRSGGIYDNVGLGFHRYSTDRFWKLPHFEKMLYDQAMIMMAYTEAYQITKNELFKRTVEEIFEYVRRDMTSQEGGFYSAEDADSEGEEGKFYLWSTSELENLLDKDDFDFLKNNYSLEDDGNFIDEVTRTQTGQNLLLPKNSEVLKNEKFNSIRNILFKEREKRIHPLKDDKILTDWNGLMTAALAKAGSVLNNEKMINLAELNSEFITNNLFSESETLLHRYRNGSVEIDGMIDDYAFTIWSKLELYEATFNPNYLNDAISLLDKAIKLFYDNSLGGFFLSNELKKDLIVRSKSIYDAAIPSGNSVMILNLIRINKITADSKYTDVIEKSIDYLGTRVNEAPTGFGMFLAAYDFYVGPSTEIILVENSDSKNKNDLINYIHEKFAPNKIVLYLNQSKEYGVIRNIADYTKSYSPIENKLTVFVCKNYECNLPVTNLESFKNLFVK